MGSTENPRTWAPYPSIRDCSQGCSIYCPQWCHVVFPPPSPFPLQSSDSSGGANFSPFVVAIIGILASAFLLVSYYTFVSKYCGNFDSSGRRPPGHSGEEQGNQSPAGEHEAWQAGSTGLEEALIKSLTVCKYKKGNGIVGITDCSVCLSEFQENENLRILPKCSHAFHVSCIDTWLKSHTNCPLCRAHIVPTGPLPPQSPPPDTPPDPSPEIRQTNDHTCVRIEELEEVSLPKPAVEDDGVHLRGRDSVIEIAGGGFRPVRSSSMDPSYGNRVSVAHVQEMSMEEDEFHLKDQKLSGGEGSSKRGEGENSRATDDRGRVLNSVSTMRSTSSGQLFYTMRHGRVD